MDSSSGNRLCFDFDVSHIRQAGLIWAKNQMSVIAWLRQLLCRIEPIAVVCGSTGGRLIAGRLDSGVDILTQGLVPLNPFIIEKCTSAKWKFSVNADTVFRKTVAFSRPSQFERALERALSFFILALTLSMYSRA